MRMPNKKTRHKFKMGLMVVQVLLGIITPSVNSVSKVMADTSEVTQQNNTSEYISDDETNKDEVAQWVTKVGAQINEQDDTNMLLGASTNTDGGFFFTTAKKMMMVH